MSSIIPEYSSEPDLASGLSISALVFPSVLPWANPRANGLARRGCLGVNAGDKAEKAALKKLGREAHTPIHTSVGL
jgi:hypothetical protein